MTPSRPPPRRPRRPRRQRRHDRPPSRAQLACLGTLAVLAVAGAAALLAGCDSSSPAGPPLGPPPGAADASTPPGDSGGVVDVPPAPGVDAASGDDTGPATSCQGPLGPPLDAAGLAALPACCQAGDLTGRAHCFPAASVPAELRSLAGSCEGGDLCIPDPILATGGAFTPPTCSSLSGAEGRCLSVCVPMVAGVASLLPADICASDERCVPCVSPLDGMPTGICELENACAPDGGADGGPPPPPPACDDPATCEYDPGCPPVVDPAGLTACAPDAHCVASALVPADLAPRLAACADATQLCVPDVFLRTGGLVTLPTCRSVANAEGRCVSQAIPEVAAQASLLPPDSCGLNELCAPCFNPLDGSDTGICSVSCDPGPAEPPTTLPSCCDSRASCVPTAAIPDQLESNLGQDSCDDGSLCVPTELTDPGFVPPTCSGDILILGGYDGVCLSDCLDFGFQGFFLDQGNCADGTTCVPCDDPISGDPTGAPGC